MSPPMRSMAAGWLRNGASTPKRRPPPLSTTTARTYVPTNGWTVFSHQFSSIAGAGPVTGAIQAAAFGWLPVLLWVLIGGVFFGAVTDFGALYASVKNEGKSMGMLIEKYIGKLGRKLFLLFCWLFCLHCHRGLCRHGGRHVQRLHRGRRRDAARRHRQDQRRCRYGVHHVHGVRRRLRPCAEEAGTSPAGRKPSSASSASPLPSPSA